MAWFKRDSGDPEKKPKSGRGREDRSHGGALAEVRRLPGNHLEERPGDDAFGVSALRLALPFERARPVDDSFRRRRV